ncbi:hypothetical protein LTR10_010958 [Elasticomyces elasticus]|nr:hypothetical protein LTR10_010958 [Elasticomyces elasticus]
MAYLPRVLRFDVKGVLVEETRPLRSATSKAQAWLPRILRFDDNGQLLEKPRPGKSYTIVRSPTLVPKIEELVDVSLDHLEDTNSTVSSTEPWTLSSSVERIMKTEAPSTRPSSNERTIKAEEPNLPEAIRARAHTASPSPSDTIVVQQLARPSTQATSTRPLGQRKKGGRPLGSKNVKRRAGVPSSRKGVSKYSGVGKPPQVSEAWWNSKSERRRVSAIRSYRINDTDEGVDAQRACYRCSDKEFLCRVWKYSSNGKIVGIVRALVRRRDRE